MKEFDNFTKDLFKNKTPSDLGFSDLQVEQTRRAIHPGASVAPDPGVGKVTVGGYDMPADRTTPGVKVGGNYQVDNDTYIGVNASATYQGQNLSAGIGGGTKTDGCSIA